MPRKWKAVQADSLPTDCVVSSVVAKAMSIAQKNSEFLQSESGIFAVVLPHKTVADCRELRFSWDGEQDVDFKRISFVASVGGSWSDQCVEDIYALRTVSDLIALPADLSKKPWDDLLLCGRVGVNGDDGPDHSLFLTKPTERSLLMHGAPKQLEKPADTLGDREKWFKSRHGSAD